MIKSNISAKGLVSIVLLDQYGNVKEERVFPNLVVTTGHNFIASRMVGTASAVMSHMAVGTGATGALVTDTTLQTELTRIALTSGTSSGNVATYVTTFGAGEGTGALTEAGIFNASSGGTMLARTTFATINKGASDTLQISWSITVS